jgi:dimethylamine monooxygenase subunit A
MPFDFDAAVTAPFRMQPGLRRLKPGAPQLTPLAPGSRHQREKLAVLSAFPTLALQARAGFDPQAALHALAAQAAAEHPQALAWDGRRARALHLGTAVDGDRVVHESDGRFGLGDEIARCLQPLPPEWRLAGLLSLAFAEDFAVLDATDGTIPWLAVALPSHWAPEDKVGRPFAAVHAPVADADLLQRAADHLVQLVSAETRWERFVWTVTGHSRLHAHPKHLDPQRWAEDVAATWPAGAWWRTEHQTFLPLPRQRQALFTIHVEQQPLAEAITTPGRARALREAVASMSPAVLDYRRLAGVRAPLLAWLERLAAPG